MAFTGVSLRAQVPKGPAGAGPTQTGADLATVIVSVRETSGMPLPGNAFVKMSSFNGVNLTSPTRDGSMATFNNLQVGEYDIAVTSAGYQPANEHASVMTGGTNNIFVYMQPEGAPVASKSGGPPLVTPHLQGQIDKGLDKLRHKQYDAARADFEKAAKTAPGNPDIQYLLGMVEYIQEHFDAAKGKFQAALSLYPTHERSLLALGELELRTGETTQAAETLEKAYQVNGADWRTHFLLASAYTAEKEYEKARPHAQRAAELGKEHGAAARVLLARILEAQGNRGEAKRLLQSVLREFPSDPAAAEAKTLQVAWETPAPVTTATTRHEPAPEAAPAPTPQPAPAQPIPAPIPANIRPWAPPDIDAKEYEVAPDVSCSMEQLMGRIQRRTQLQLSNFEKFMATEHIEHREVDAYGNSGVAREKDFNYLVFVERPRKGYIFLEEERDGGDNLGSFPTSLATRGLVGLGVLLFSPEYQPDLDYKCEGLGKWRDMPAWQVRFEQKADVESRLRTWRNNRGVFPVPLKGRAWIAANRYDVLHVETDLREPVPAVELTRDHLIVDYGPVQFKHNQTSLWLPWYAEMYMELHGKRYHHRHTLTNYTLFAVDTNHKISTPKDE